MVKRLGKRMMSELAPEKRPGKLSGKGDPGYDNTRENIDPHVRTKVITTKEVVVGPYTLPKVDGTASQVIITNGAGSLTWAAQSGGGASAEWISGATVIHPRQTAQTISGANLYSDGDISGVTLYGDGSNLTGISTTGSRWASGATIIYPLQAAQVISGAGLVVTGTVSGVNVTSGADPGHTHTGASLSSIDVSADTNLAGGTGITLTDDTLSTTDSEIVHDNLSGFAANEHINWTGASDALKTTGTISGVNVTSGADPGHTHTIYDKSEWVSGALFIQPKQAAQSVSGATLTAGNANSIIYTNGYLTISGAWAVTDPSVSGALFVSGGAVHVSSG